MCIVTIVTQVRMVCRLAYSLVIYMQCRALHLTGLLADVSTLLSDVQALRGPLASGSMQAGEEDGIFIDDVDQIAAVDSSSMRAEATTSQSELVMEEAYEFQVSN